MLAINDKIEDICYFNKDIYEIYNYVENFTITSIQIFRYSNELNDDLLHLFLLNNNFYDINKYLRGQLNTNVNLNIINNISNFINNSPTINEKFVVYRGIDCHIDVTIGDVLSNLGFLFCSLDKDTAKFYLNDTTACYQDKIIDISKCKPSKFSTLFKIYVPSHTHFLDVSYFDHVMQKVISELIFDKDIGLQIIDIDKNNNILIITTIII